MRIRQFVAAGLLAMAAPLPASAVMPENFMVRTSQDLMELCTTPPADALYREAIHFCHGYVVGAVSYLRAATSGPGAQPLACMPDPPPSRDGAIAQFAAWMRQNPQYMGELPVSTMLRYLQLAYPCRR